jgi:hypothetical protein
MTQLLNEAFEAACKLSPEHQDNLAYLIFNAIKQQTKQKATKKPSFLEPVREGSGYKDTSINHDVILAEGLLNQKLPPLS